MPKKGKYSTLSDKRQLSTTSTKSKYIEKPPLKLKGMTQYLSLTMNDSLYKQNISQIANQQFRLLLKRILLDLNALLYFSESDFFQQLQNSSSLRVCLESCLVCLPKRTFCRLMSGRQINIKKGVNQHQPQYQSYYLYEKLYEVVLCIYLRISQAKNQKHKQSIYDEWILDVPKMIDFSLLYVVPVDQNSYANLEIVRYIISNTIATNPSDYYRDIEDFINLIYEKRIPKILEQLNIRINLSKQALKTAQQNYHNAQRSFLISANQIIFTIKDLFLSILYFYLCFPPQFREKLATDHEIQQGLIRIYQKFSQNTPQWNTDLYKQKFQINFQDVKQKIYKCFLQTFNILHVLIDKGQDKLNDHYSRAMNTYCIFCISLYKENSTKEIKSIQSKPFTSLIETLVYKKLQKVKYQNQNQKPFFLLKHAPQMKFIKISPKQQQAIYFCYLEEQAITENIKNHIYFQEHYSQSHIQTVFRQKQKKILLKQRMNIQEDVLQKQKVNRIMFKSQQSNYQNKLDLSFHEIQISQRNERLIQQSNTNDRKQIIFKANQKLFQQTFKYKQSQSELSLLIQQDNQHYYHQQLESRRNQYHKTNPVLLNDFDQPFEEYSEPPRKIKYVTVEQFYAKKGQNKNDISSLTQQGGESSFMTTSNTTITNNNKNAFKKKTQNKIVDQNSSLQQFLESDSKKNVNLKKQKSQRNWDNNISTNYTSANCQLKNLKKQKQQLYQKQKNHNNSIKINDISSVDIKTKKNNEQRRHMESFSQLYQKDGNDNDDQISFTLSYKEQYLEFLYFLNNQQQQQRDSLFQSKDRNNRSRGQYQNQDLNLSIPFALQQSKIQKQRKKFQKLQKLIKNQLSFEFIDSDRQAYPQSLPPNNIQKKLSTSESFVYYQQQQQQDQKRKKQNIIHQKIKKSSKITDIYSDINNINNNQYPLIKSSRNKIQTENNDLSFQYNDQIKLQNKYSNNTKEHNKNSNTSSNFQYSNDRHFQNKQQQYQQKSQNVKANNDNNILPKDLLRVLDTQDDTGIKQQHQITISHKKDHNNKYENNSEENQQVNLSFF